MIKTILLRFPIPKPSTLLALAFIIYFSTQLHGQAANCSCTNCPLLMKDLFTGTFPITVENAANPTLGQNGQALCGVKIHFDHSAICDERMALTSPSGQTITLVGPIGNTCTNNGNMGSDWDVTFLPCMDPTVAPDAGIAAHWSNAQPWGANTNYTGSYYPNAGCLESFTGPVNGNWTLTVVDGQAQDTGTMYYWELIFCDPTGIDCFHCAAEAGNLAQADMVRCEGNVALTLLPTYTNSAEPPINQYSYAYVISNPAGVILAIQPSPDLSGYPPGNYNVCGLSYYTYAGNKIPTPDGVLTVNTLRNQLNTNIAPFCGDITPNCVGVTIQAAPPDIEEYAEVCYPNCYDFYGVYYCQAGTYTTTLSDGICDYKGKLHLTVHQVNNTFLNETVCAGTCSTNPLFPTACTAGGYQTVLQNTFGCDSTIHLNLTVITVNAVIPPPPPVLTCAQPTAILQGTGSTAGAGTAYQWLTSGTGHFVGATTNINATVDKPGVYQLRVCRTQGGAFCCDTAAITVTSTQGVLAAPAISGSTSLCAGQTATFSVAANPNATGYTWTVPAGVTINSGLNTNSINVSWNAVGGGNVCVTADNLCGPSAPACQNVTTTPALTASQPAGNSLVCTDSTATYSIVAVANATSYTWTVPAPATIVSGQGTNTISVHWGAGPSGNVCVSVNGSCGASPQVCLPVTINAAPASPAVSGPAVVCAGDGGSYTVASVTGATSYNWVVTGGTITSGNGTSSVQVLWDGNTASGTVCATASGSCGQSAANCFNVTINKVPTQPSISGPLVACTGNTSNYSLINVNGAQGYTWTVPTGGTIVSGQNTTAITVNWTASASGNICVTANNACGPSLQNCLPVIASTQPLANAGTDGAVCGNVFNLSATPSVNNSTGAWTSLAGNPGTVTFGNATVAGTTATVSQNGAYAFAWKETNGSCASTDTVTITFNGLPTAGQTQASCDAANQNYTIVFPVSGGTLPYTIPGGSFANGTFTSSLVVSGQPYTFTITDANGCTAQTVSGSFACNCSSNAGQMSQQPLSACPGSSVTAQYLGGGGMDASDVSAYVLHTNAGASLGTVLGENATGTFSFGNGMSYGTTYYISYAVGNNLNGQPDPADPCFSVAAGQPVTFYDNPVANAGTDAAICGLTLPLSGNAGSGAWTVTQTPGGASAQVANPQSASTSVTASAFGLYTLTYTLTANGCTGSDDVALTFNESPSAGTIQQNCDGTNQNYTVGFPITGGTAPYSVNGNTVVGTNFLSAPLLSGQTYNLTVTDANGCFSPAISGSYNCNCATNAGQMALAPLTACTGGTISAQFLGGQNLDANDTSAWVLHTGSGVILGTVLAQNHTGQFTFGNGMSYGTTYYVSRVAGNNLNGFPDPNDPCFSLAQGQPVTFFDNPVANAGTDQSTCGLTLTLNGNSGTAASAWTITGVPAGATASLADATDPASAITASTFGLYTLTYTLTANGCTGSDNVALTFNESPAAGLIQRSCDGANQNYTVSFPITGGAGPYTVNGNAVAGSNFVSGPLPSGQSFSFTLTDANGCSSPAITGSYNCNCATNAGQMALTTLTACGSDALSAQFLGGQSLDANDTTSWVLHTGAGIALGTVFGQNHTGQFTFGNGMTYGTTYYISRTAGNNLNGFPDPSDPCFSVAQGQPVVFLQQPVPNAGATATVCGQSINLSAVNDGFPGSWSQVSGSGNATFANAANPINFTSVDANGIYVFRWTETNGMCSASADVSIEFHAIPAITGLVSTCNNTNTGYTLTFTITGGTAPFTANGLSGSFSGNTFTSTLLADNSPYNFSVTDLNGNGCTSLQATGSHACNCATNAGTMLTVPATFCADQPATATWNNNATLDADDAVQYILHSQSGNSLGAVYVTNAQPSFNFGPGLQTGVVYYLSAIAGSSSSGTIDLNDPCLSVAPGTPVQWKPLPSAGLTGDATICKGGTTALNFTGSGVYPLQLSYSDGSGTPLSLLLPNATVVSLNVTPTTTTTYTLLSVVDGTNPTCSTTLNTAVTVTVNQPVSAGTAAAPMELCAGQSSTIQLGDLLQGADPGGQWTETSATHSLPGAFNASAGTFQTSGQPAGNYTFRYAVSALAPCPGDNETVSVMVHALPVADAGPDQIVKCNQPSVTLGGGGTSSGASYDWTLNGTSVGQSAQLSTSNSGVYNLLVSNASGCTASDMATVGLDQEIPQATAKVQAVKCFGDANGRITLDSIVSTHPPVLVSINGGPFSAQSDFSSLVPGSYTVTLQSATGCEWTMPTVVLAQPPQLLVDLGSTIEAALGDSVDLTAQASVPLSSLQSILWQPVLDSLNAHSLSQHFFPLTNQRITLLLTDANGCTASSSVQVNVDRKRHVYIGNIIRPGSSLNDQLVVYGGRDVAEIETFQVYDRWGSLLFETSNFQPNDLTKGWDGKNKGKLATPGVYVYYAVIRFIDGERELFNGDVTVYR